jgi:GNAT superfamily N-acetyltransferase
VPDMHVRAAEERDLSSIAAITLATNQHDEWAGGNPAYVRHLMNHGRVVVAEVAGQVSGFGATQRIGTGTDAVTVLCDLFVDPAVHGQGVGRAILTELWSNARRKQTFSSRHAHALPLYTSFGVDAWWPLLYLQGDPAGLTVPAGWRVAQVGAGQAAACERDWTAIDRAADYQAWATRPGAESVQISSESVSGSTVSGSTVSGSTGSGVIATGIVVRSGPETGVMRLVTAPVVEGTVAEDDIAAAAVLAALAGLTGLANVCLPGPHPAVRPLLAAGWRVTDFDLFMASEPGLLDPRRAVPSPSHG